MKGHEAGELFKKENKQLLMAKKKMISKDMKKLEVEKKKPEKKEKGRAK